MKNINKKKLTILLITSVIFLIFMAFVIKKDVLNIDAKVYNLILDNKSKRLDIIMKLITQFGEAYMLIGITFLVAILVKYKKISLLIILNLITNSTLNYLLKTIVHRDRPIWKTLDISGFSFPSGHTMIGLATYGFFIYLIYRFVKNKNIKYISISLISILILLVSFSRIYLGVHYFSDVVAGLSLSIAYLLVYCHYARIYLKLKK